MENAGLSIVFSGPGPWLSDGKGGAILEGDMIVKGKAFIDGQINAPVIPRHEDADALSEIVLAEGEIATDADSLYLGDGVAGGGKLLIGPKTLQYPGLLYEKNLFGFSVFNVAASHRMAYGNHLVILGYLRNIYLFSSLISFPVQLNDKVPSGYEFLSVAYSDRYFLGALQNTSTSDIIPYRTKDGSTWETLSESIGEYVNPIRSGGFFSFTSSNELKTTVDAGDNWTVQATLLADYGSDVRADLCGAYHVVYGVGTKNFAFSFDGLSWTERQTTHNIVQMISCFGSIVMLDDTDSISLWTGFTFLPLGINSSWTAADDKMILGNDLVLLLITYFESEDKTKFFVSTDYGTNYIKSNFELDGTIPSNIGSIERCFFIRNIISGHTFLN